MKHFFCFFFLHCCNIAEAQTYANIPAPENVLVIYKVPSNPQDTLGNTSLLVKNYYQTIRGVPTVNTLGLAGFPSSDVLPSGTATIESGGEIIKSSGTKAAWEYYKKYIADPLESYLTNTYVGGQPLKNTVRYIVLCKGIPLKLWTYENYNGDECPGATVCNYSWTHYRNVAVDALVCLLFQNVLNLYDASVGQLNPYYNNADMNFTFNYRFVTNNFVNSNSWYINYLVSRLDADNYSDISAMIYRSDVANKSGLGYWIFDADLCHNTEVTVTVHNGNYMSTAQNNLITHSFNTNPSSYTPNCDFITGNPSGDVMGYTSCGRHSWLGLACGEFNANYFGCFSFNYSPGAVSNTFESYNGSSMIQVLRHEDYGMIVDFIKAGGTGGIAHTWEPLLSKVALNNNFFNLYAMGYGLVDAAYQAIPYLAWQNIVIGDPLTTIAWGKQTLTQNLTWSGTNLVTGEVTVPSGKTLSIQNNSTIRLRHQGIIGGAGILNIGSNVIVNTDDWTRSVLLSNSGLNPRLVWAAHPSFTTTNFKVYRAISSSQVSDPSTLSYQLIYTSANSSTFSFTDPDIMISTGSYVYYYVTAFNLINPRTGYGVESGRSNYASVRGDMYKRSYETAARLNQELDYSLEQNYPNPFNPKTQIRYSLKEDGFVTLKLYDILGNEITTLVSEPKSQGIYTVDFETANLSSGVYIYQLKTNNYIACKKMIISK